MTDGGIKKSPSQLVCCEGDFFMLMVEIPFNIPHYEK